MPWTMSSATSCSTTSARATSRTGGAASTSKARASTGRWVVTRDEAPDPRSLALRLTLNGVVKQEGNTRDMIHPVDATIEWASKGMTLLPGALIATGTPDGVGFARKPPEFLHPGDLMETEVVGIGLLRNRIVAAKVGALADHSHRGA